MAKKLIGHHTFMGAQIGAIDLQNPMPAKYRAGTIPGDDYIHGWLDTDEIIKAIEMNKSSKA